MSKLLGANWQTTVSGIGTALFSALTALAALPYTLGDLATAIPPNWKPRIFAASLTATIALRIWNSVAQKDKNVTGGTVQQDQTGNTVPEHRAELVQMTRGANALLLVVTATFLIGCSNMTPEQIAAASQGTAAVISSATGLAQQGFQDYKEVVSGDAKTVHKVKRMSGKQKNK